MEDCVAKLGSLYGGLAGIQAEVKVNGMSPGLLYRIKDICVAHPGWLKCFRLGALTQDSAAT